MIIFSASFLGFLRDHLTSSTALRTPNPFNSSVEFERALAQTQLVRSESINEGALAAVVLQSAVVETKNLSARRRH